MSTYVVSTERVETIVFQLQAASPADAEERFLAEGDEVSSETTRFVVTSVDEAETP